jgi:ribonuclease HI
MARKTRSVPVIPDEGALSIFVDGSSLSGPRRGGVGIRFVYADRLGNETVWDSPQVGVERGTIGQMELLAVITALEEVLGRRLRSEVLGAATKIVVYTDSQYVANNVTNVMFVWPKQRWMTRDGPPVQNAELWQRLVRELGKLKRLKRVEIKWAKGHSADNPHNKAADALAKASAKRPVRPQLVPGTVRRKKSEQPTEAGSVAMLGQRLRIRIISADYLATQRTNKYRYEVMSPGSAYVGKVDIAYSDDPLMRPGHVYVVTMGRDQNHPTIAKLLREVMPDA